MYICSSCGQRTQKGEPMVRVVTGTRIKVYPVRGRANRWCEAKRTWPDDPGGVGVEIVNEGGFCPKCVAAAAPAERGTGLTG